MTLATLTWVTLGAVILYMVSVDENVGTWLVLLSKSMSIWFQQQWFKVRYNPDSPWVRWQIDRNADSIAKELQSELQDKNK